MKKGKTHVTPSPPKSIINKQADTLLRQIRTENAVKDLVRSNRRMGIVVPKSVKVSSCSYYYIKSNFHQWKSYRKDTK